MGWNRPSARVCELIRQGAELVVNVPQQWHDELDSATLASEYMPTVGDDPVLADEVRRSNRTNQLHWAAANISHPGEPVAANVGADSLSIARDLIRRGLDESALLDAYRIGQNVAWQQWMRIAFELTSDPGEQRELLEVSARSITSFINATIAGIRQQLRTERDELTRGTHAERREIVGLILHGAAITPQHAEDRLGYRLDQSHTAVVLWTDESDADLTDLDRAAEALTHTTDGLRPLSVLAGAATRWLWLPGGGGPALARASTAVSHLPGVRIAVGATAAGLEGFRSSHLDAITTQRMMARLGSVQRVASFVDVELIALITSDPESAERFVKHTLGDFQSADAELQRTVLTYVQEQCNASRAAAKLFTHRNTLLNRLARANELLPRPLEVASVYVAVALETLRWRGVAR
ncbi:CdaR family transcriptional regulator [Mycolicibacterium sp. P1-5]|uniref:PucR family transcriptional regulator n=1 Tax=Mycolicibacterium sp. P1-5 TaxID=2024617 RepID=UPI0011ED0630|nr:PucR family transcriptional regulator [Mycolicibacterium sp. P1-5]KAA0102824.1 PucR family transcriptional regulator [Mycolicibacterium sp. P1-5]